MGMTPIKIAIVGAGYMAQEHARAFADQPDVAIVGVVSRNRERAQAIAQRYGASVFVDIATMYEATRADAVIVAVNEPSMHSVSRQALALPWLCLLEKPVGLTLSEAREIVEFATAKGARAYVALNRRSYSATLNAAERLARDDGPRLISITDQQDLDAVRADNQPPMVVQNYMYVNSIHMIDYFTRFGRGAVSDVKVVAPWTPESPGYVVATISFTSGDRGVYQAVWNGPGPWSVVVTNPAIRAEMRPLEVLHVQNRSERRLVEVPLDELDRQFKPGLHRQAREFCSAIRGEETDLCGLEENWRSMLLCAQIYGLAPPPNDGV